MNRSWVRFPQAAQIRPPGSGWAFLHARVVLLVAPRVFRAPEGPAAREARRLHFVRRRASKPARALRTLRRPPHQWGLVCWRVAWLVGSKPGQAQPPPTGAAAWFSGPPNVVWLVVLVSWGAPLCVVTNVVNRRCFSCGFLIRCYKRRQSDGFFAENQGFWKQVDDVRNMSTRKGVQTAPV